MTRASIDNYGRFFAVVLLAAASMLLSGASDCSGFGAFCDFDSDCSDGRLCVESECREPCTEDTDCFGSDECDVVARQAEDDTVQVCIPEEPVTEDDAGTDTDCTTVENCCTSDEQCREALGDPGAVCGFDDRCVIPVEKHAIAIRGQTDSVLDPEDGVPGADIGAVWVRDVETAEPLGYAEVIAYDFTASPDVLPEDILDGSAPDLDATEQCVAGNIETDTFGLGGQGSLVLVAFVDGDGQRIRLDDSMELVAIEWGANCYEQTDADEGFSMDFCRAFGGSIDAREDCATPLTGGEPVSGYVVIPLDGAV
ncbi:MAG: hypothetical protein ACQEVA_05905 [Myxococcota bacterium]